MRGASTLIQIAVGLLKRDGSDVTRPARIGYCPRTPMLWEKLIVEEHFERLALAYGLGEDGRERSVLALLEELQFGKYRSYRIEELSGGARQKLNLAISLMHEPELLLLGEPYSGFDWETYVRFWEIGRAPARRRHGHRHRLPPARRARAPGSPLRTVRGAGVRVLSAALLSLDFTREHGAVVIGFAALLGVFFTRSALQGDRRFVVAGFPPGETVVACVAVLGVATAVVVVVSAIVTALDFTPDSWAPLLAAMVLLGLIYTGTGARSTSSAPPPWCCSW